MTEKKVTEADKAELRDMAAVVAVPCPFKVGDVVVLKDRDAAGSLFSRGPKFGRAAIVVNIRLPSGANADERWSNGLAGIGDMMILFKDPDDNVEAGFKWDTRTVESWQYQRA